MKYTILIPPSEGKATGGHHSPIEPSSAIQSMIETLQQYSGDQQKLLGVKGVALDMAIQTNKDILTSKTLPAIERYTGVVYKALDYPSLPAPAQKFADNHIRIVSAIFGLVKPRDHIPNYKLKIEKLHAAKYWQPTITKQLEGTFVIDLLPQAHKKAVSWKKGINVEFKIMQNGAAKPAGHMGKHIKGRFVRWLCEKQITDPRRFSEFSEEGFIWNGNQFVLEK
jgi:cytoplasmic iron level regulating protein YaaA (DUF328/UPF0246 family)